MKNIQNRLIVLLFIPFAFPYLGSSQEGLTNELRFEVNRIYPPVSINKERLTESHTLSDLNKNYQSSWIREYISVEVLTSYNERIIKAVSKNDTLSQEQKDIMNMADVGSSIAVEVQYLPQNTLKHNDVKEIDFTFTVNPESEATFAGGQQALEQYLKENAIDKIPEGSFKGFDLVAIQFAIDEEGQIIDVHVFESSKDEKIDALLLSTISKMPGWQPAEYADGTKVKQDYVFTVGSMENCMINLLNIRQD